MFLSLSDRYPCVSPDPVFWYLDFSLVYFHFSCYLLGIFFISETQAGISTSKYFHIRLPWPPSVSAVVGDMRSPYLPNEVILLMHRASDLNISVVVPITH